MTPDEIIALVREIKSLGDSKPHLALVQARKAAEAVCRSIWEFYGDEPWPRKMMLDQMIARLTKDKNVPATIATSLRTVQHFGNIGSHYSEQGDALLSAVHISPCLQALANVIQWYCEQSGVNPRIAMTASADMPGRNAKRQLEKQTKLERLSLSLSLEMDDDVTDNWHLYESLTRVDVLNTREGHYSSHRWFKITNVSNQPTISVPHMEAGENKITYESMRIRAHTTDRNGKQLTVTPTTTAQPNFVQKFQIHFERPLAPGDSMTIYYRLSWPGEPYSYSGGEHSQSVSLLRYCHGVNRLVFGVMDQSALSAVRASKVLYDFGEEALAKPPTYVSTDDVAGLEPLSGNGITGALFEFNPVDAACYRVFYRLQEAEEGENPVHEF